MMRILRFVVLYLVTLPVMAAAAVYSPATVPDPKQFGQGYYVSNPDSILNADDVDYLNQCCQMLEDSTEVEMAVVVLESIGDYEPFDFGFELFNRWGIGKEGKNTGVLITFALASRQVYINTGSGIEGVLTDAKCKMVIQSDMIPRFKEGDYGGGLCAAATDIYTICTKGEAPEELLNMTSATNRGKFGKPAESQQDMFSTVQDILFILGILFLFLLPFLLIVLYQRKTQPIEDENEQRMSCLVKLGCLCLFFPFFLPSLIWFWWRSKRFRCPQCGKQKYKVIDKTEKSLNSTLNLQTLTWQCSACGYKKLETKSVKKSTDSYGGYSSSGGFGSYSSSSSRSSRGSWGGGSSSGGGAGGSW